MTYLLIVPNVGVFAKPSLQNVRLGTFTCDNPYRDFARPLGRGTVEGDRRHRVTAKPPLGPLR